MKEKLLITVTDKIVQFDIKTHKICVCMKLEINWKFM